MRYLEAVVDLPAAEAAVRLREQVRDDPEGLEAALEMLAALGRDPVLDQQIGLTIVAGELKAARREEIPDQIGPFRILKELEAGGMGVVYVASDPRLDRRVAIKFIGVLPCERGTTMVGQLHQRADGEARALAKLDHPGIARIYEVGHAADGRLPYIVMEFVQDLQPDGTLRGGVPITEYARRHDLTVRQRLALFSQVCAAVRHCHQKTIVHRDLKPSNILVQTDGTGEPQPKIIDFGISVPYPAPNGGGPQVAGTPGYMSPQQASGQSGEQDVQWDVYALGAVLYELLSGRPAFDWAGLPPEQQIKLAADGTRLAPKLDARLGMDLGLIVAHALEPSTDRRYPSVAGLQADVDAVLHRRPISLRRQHRPYVAGRFLRRHWAASGLAAALALGLVATTVWALLSRQAAITAQAATQQQVLRLERLWGFYRGVFTLADPFLGEGPRTPVGKVVEALEGQIDPMLGQDPEIQRLTWFELADTYLSWGDGASALRVIEPVIAAIEREGDRTSVDAAGAHARRGRALWRMGRREEAETSLRGAQRIASARAGADPQLAACTFNLGEFLLDEDRWDEARTELEAAERLAAQVGDTVLAQRVAVLLAYMHHQLRDGLALERFEAAVDGLTRSLGPEHPYTLRAMNDYAMCLKDEGLLEAAETMMTTVATKLRARMGLVTEDAGTLLCNLASVKRAFGKLDEAAVLAVEGVAVLRESVGESAVGYASGLNTLASVELQRGNMDRAVTAFEEVLGIRLRIREPDHREVIESKINLSAALRRSGKPEPALELGRAALASALRVYPDGHPQLISAMYVTAAALVELDRHGEAVSLVKPVAERFIGTEMLRGQVGGLLIDLLVGALERTGQQDAAQQWADRRAAGGA